MEDGGENSHSIKGLALERHLSGNGHRLQRERRGTWERGAENWGNMAAQGSWGLLCSLTGKSTMEPLSELSFKKQDNEPKSLDLPTRQPTLHRSQPVSPASMAICTLVIDGVILMVNC